jgi:hypothetical protein
MKRHYYGAAVMLAAVVSCGNGRAADEEPMTPASQSQGYSESEELGEAERCVSTEECPDGYSCGFDPGRSRVSRYCMPE